jgi:hypothetical protein
MESTQPTQPTQPIKYIICTYPDFRCECKSCEEESAYEAKNPPKIVIRDFFIKK